MPHSRRAKFYNAILSQKVILGFLFLLSESHIVNSHEVIVKFFNVVLAKPPCHFVQDGWCFDSCIAELVNFVKSIHFFIRLKRLHTRWGLRTPPRRSVSPKKVFCRMFSWFFLCFDFLCVLFAFGLKSFAVRSDSLCESVEIVWDFEKLGHLASVVSSEVLCCENDLFDLFFSHVSSVVEIEIRSSELKIYFSFFSTVGLSVPKLSQLIVYFSASSRRFWFHSAKDLRASMTCS